MVGLALLGFAPQGEFADNVDFAGGFGGSLQYELDPQGIVIASTHAHSAPDLIGGWGFVPDWYMEQISGAIKESIRQAVANPLLFGRMNFS